MFFCDLRGTGCQDAAAQRRRQEFRRWGSVSGFLDPTHCFLRLHRIKRRSDRKEIKLWMASWARREDIIYLLEILQKYRTQWIRKLCSLFKVDWIRQNIPHTRDIKQNWSCYSGAPFSFDRICIGDLLSELLRLSMFWNLTLGPLYMQGHLPLTSSEEDVQRRLFTHERQTHQQGYERVIRFASFCGKLKYKVKRNNLVYFQVLQFNYFEWWNTARVTMAICIVWSLPREPENSKFHYNVTLCWEDSLPDGVSNSNTWTSLVHWLVLNDSQAARVLALPFLWAWTVIIWQESFSVHTLCGKAGGYPIHQDTSKKLHLDSALVAIYL